MWDNDVEGARMARSPLLLAFSLLLAGCASSPSQPEPAPRTADQRDPTPFLERQERDLSSQRASGNVMGCEFVYDEPLEDLLHEIGAQVGWTITADPQLAEKKVSNGDLNGVPWRDAVAKLAARAGGRVLERAPKTLLVATVD